MPAALGLSARCAEKEDAMTRERAIELIRNLISAEVESMKQMSTKGKTTKKADLQEQKAAVAIFNGLTDEHPTAEEIEAMVQL
jgi:hypothetical protein